jgi:type I restriction enzyme, S subunit
MKRYESYKPSGIEWLGEIPEHWMEKRVKEIGNVVLGKMLCNNPQLGYSLKPYLKSKNIGWIKVNTDSVEEMYFSKTEMKQYKIRKDDLLLSEGGEVGKTCIWKNEIVECYIQNSVHKITFPKSVEPRYYLYFSFATGVLGGYDSIVNFISIKHLTYEKLNRVIWAVPPLQEQTTLANYLDSKTTAIDRKIELLTAKADKYKALRRSLINETVCRGLNPKVPQKDSGIEWIGMIPEHWEVKRVKDEVNIINGFAFDSETYLDNGLPIIRIGDISNNIDFENVKFISKESATQAKYSKIKKKDILMAMTGATIGKSAYYQSDRVAYLNQRVCSFRVQNSSIPAFVKYYIESRFTQDLILLVCGGSAQDNISKYQLENFYIIKPPPKEQTVIAAYLDVKTFQIDTILTNISEQINKLTQLRKTLINDVITGKIKVTED